MTVCASATLNGFVLDATTPDLNGVQYLVMDLAGWWDMPDTRVEQAAVPDGTVVTVARTLGWPVVLTGAAYKPGDTPIGSYAYTTIETIHTAFDGLLQTAAPLVVTDGNGARTQMTVRLNGPIKFKQNVAGGRVVSITFQVPLIATNPTKTVL